MGLQLREGKINWIRDLNGSTSATPFPSAATDGIAPGTIAGGRAGSHVHVGLDYTCASGTMSVTVSLYGYTQTGTFPGWKYLGGLNGGSSITVNSSTSAVSATQMTLAEVFECSGENYERYATRSIPGGNSPVVSTYIGFALE